MMITRCCKNVLGCEACVTEYYEKDELAAGMNRKFPICRADRAFSEISRLNGTEDFLKKVAPLMEEEEDSDGDYNPFMF